MQSTQLILKLGQLPAASHAAVNVNEGHRHACENAGDQPP
jgi:hypothetical protein